MDKQIPYSGAPTLWFNRVSISFDPEDTLRVSHHPSTRAGVRRIPNSRRQPPATPEVFVHVEFAIYTGQPLSLTSYQVLS